MTEGVINAALPAGVIAATTALTDPSNWGSYVGAGGAFVWLLYVSIRQEKRLSDLQARLDKKSQTIIDMSERLSTRCGACELAKSANQLLLARATNNQPQTENDSKAKNTSHSTGA